MMFSILISLLILVVATVAAQNMTIPFDYPLFKQCDPRWADDIMVTTTICAVGCLMSSTSMGLAGVDIPIKSSTPKEINSNPKTLNQWLIYNHGYDEYNDMYETQIPLIDPERITWPVDGMHKTNDLSFDTIRSYLDKGRIVIANVNDGGHFVLLTGYSVEDSDTFSVNDPGYERYTYSYKDDVVGYRIFDMARE